MTGQLIDVVSEKVAEAQDNLWLLQTDPAYFHWTASYWNKHDIGNFPGAKISKASLKQALGSRMIIGSPSNVLAWQDIFSILVDVKRKRKAPFLTTSGLDDLSQSNMPELWLHCGH